MVLILVPVKMLKSFVDGVYVLMGPAGKAAAFHKTRLLGHASYRGIPIPAEEWNIQAYRENLCGNFKFPN